MKKLNMNLQLFAGQGVKLTTSDDIFIEVNNVRVAGVQNYNVDFTSNNKRHDAFGQRDGIGWSESEQEYTITLTRLYLEDTAINDGLDFYDIVNEQFNIVIDKNGKRTTYSTCSIQGIREVGDLKQSVMETLTVQALTRTKTS